MFRFAVISPQSYFSILAEHKIYQENNEYRNGPDVNPVQIDKDEALDLIQETIGNFGKKIAVNDTPKIKIKLGTVTPFFNEVLNIDIFFLGYWLFTICYCNLIQNLLFNKFNTLNLIYF